MTFVVLKATISTDLKLNTEIFLTNDYNVDRRFLLDRGSSVRLHDDWVRVVKGQLMAKLEGAIAQHNLDLAVWLARKILRDSCESQKQEGNSAYSCKDSYSDEFVSSRELMTHMAPLMQMLSTG
jgi:hypothetical protein